MGEIRRGPVAGSCLPDAPHGARYNLAVVIRSRTRRAPTAPRGAAARLAQAERLFADFRELTPYRFRPFARTFATFAAYEKWRRGQSNPWYR